MTSFSLINQGSARLDASLVLLALVIANQTRIAAERAATAGDVRRSRAAARAAKAIACAIAELERLKLPEGFPRDAQCWAGEPLAVSNTVTPAERAWVLAWHLLAASARIHSRASSAGQPKFGERATARAADYTRDALRDLEPLLTSHRRAELRAPLSPPALSLDAQLRLFAPVLPTPRPWRATSEPFEGGSRRSRR